MALSIASTQLAAISGSSVVALQTRSAKTTSALRAVRIAAPRARTVTPRPQAPDVAPLKPAAPLPSTTTTTATAPAANTTYPFASLPPTPVFPSSHAMATFLQSYGRMLQHVQTAATAAAGDGHARDAIVSGDALAAAGTTVVERVRLGLMALVGHPVHGVAGGAAWCVKERAVERCLAELERDVEGIRAAHERPPRAAALALATAHCLDAARMIRQL